MSDTKEPDLDSGLSELKPFSGTTIVPVIKRACEACRWSFIEKPDMVCRRNPPHVGIVLAPQMVPTPQGMKQAMAPMPVTSFPIMRRDQWCGEFEPKGR